LEEVDTVDTPSTSSNKLKLAEMLVARVISGATVQPGE